VTDSKPSRTDADVPPTLERCAVVLAPSSVLRRAEASVAPPLVRGVPTVVVVVAHILVVNASIIATLELGPQAGEGPSSTESVIVLI